MKRIEQWEPIFLVFPRKVSGQWLWLKRVMRKGNEYMSEEDFIGMVDSQKPTRVDIDDLLLYTADEILEGKNE